MPPSSTVAGVFDSVFPIITTPDLGRLLGFYRDLLDGEVRYSFPPDGEPGYVSLAIGESAIGLGHDPALDPTAPAPQRFALWVYTPDCAAAVERLRTAGVTIVQEPEQQPWGEIVARVEDPDGNTVHIGQAPA
jgi:lactoylglutathione lyase